MRVLGGTLEYMNCRTGVFECSREHTHMYLDLALPSFAIRLGRDYPRPPADALILELSDRAPRRAATSPGAFVIGNGIDERDHDPEQDARDNPEDVRLSQPRISASVEH